MRMSRYYLRKQQGVCCGCGKEKEDADKVNCRACRERIAQTRLIRVAEYKDLGICGCGKPIDNKAYKTCTLCRASSNNSQRSRYYRRREQKLCTLCGGKLDNDIYTKCLSCIEYMRRYYDFYYHK